MHGFLILIVGWDPIPFDSMECPQSLLSRVRQSVSPNPLAFLVLSP